MFKILHNVTFIEIYQRFIKILIYKKYYHLFSIEMIMFYASLSQEIG